MNDSISFVALVAAAASFRPRAVGNVLSERLGPARILFQALSPIPRLSPVVSDGENSNLAVDVKVHDMVREANRMSSHWQISRHPWHGRPGIGQHHDLVDGGVDDVEELDAQVL